MKQTFQTEIIIHDDGRALTRCHIGAALVNGMRDCFKREISVIGAEEIIVEQNCGTPESTEEKALDLLKRAMQSLNDYCDYTGGCMKDSLGKEIEEHIRENTKG